MGSNKFGPSTRVKVSENTYILYKAFCYLAVLLTGAVLRLPDGGLYVAEEGDLCDVEEEPRPGRVAEGEVGDDVADAERRVVQLHAADVAQRAHLARVLVLQHVPVAQELQVTTYP